jgi:hypothetical protein
MKDFKNKKEGMGNAQACKYCGKMSCGCGGGTCGTCGCGEKCKTEKREQNNR